MENELSTQLRKVKSNGVHKKKEERKKIRGVNNESYKEKENNE